MDSLTPASLPVAARGRARIVLPSRVAYDLQPHETRDGLTLPRMLGSGRFAKVFAAQQIIDGQPGRLVAIKVLHDHVDYQAERLFTQEIALNREFSCGSHAGLPAILDTIHLGPLVMCGCGVLYHPMCPNGCGLVLQRINLKHRPFPALRCSGCDYSLSAEFVREPRAAALFGPTAKPCCTADGDPYAHTGTIVNFVLREAMVMELLEVSLADYAAFSDGAESQPAPPLSPLERASVFFGLTAAPTRLTRLAQKVRLLAKVDLMVRIAETVVQLHERMHVVHKDIAPDNIMICHASRVVRGEFPEGSAVQVLDQAANVGVRPCVIDFGLSDRKELSRSWYEDADLRAAVTKLPYLSPEARLRRQSIGPVEFDPVKRRFRVPAALLQSSASIATNDIIVDGDDMSHAGDVKVTKFEREGEQHFACFEGAAPRDHVRSFEVIRPLGEAHDVYALGAVFCYVLTGRHDEVENLGNLVRSIQEQPCPLERWHLSRRDNYANRLQALREPFWRDDLMEVMLRAMVRGRPESYAESRTVRGAGPVRRLLAELKQIQQGMLADVFSEHGQVRTTRRRRLVAIGFVVLLAALVWPGPRGWFATEAAAPPVEAPPSSPAPVEPLRFDSLFNSSAPEPVAEPPPKIADPSTKAAKVAEPKPRRGKKL